MKRAGANGPRVVAIIQARMGSTRLPGKTLIDIAGTPLLAHILERVKASQTIDEIVVATTTGTEDAAILRLAEDCGVQSYAGSADDVLDRFYQAALRSRADVIVRITADDPFKDPVVIDTLVQHWLVHPDLDYVSNTVEPTFPEGLDIEVLTMAALDRAWRQGQLPSEREHVTPYVWKHPERFRIANVKHTENLSHLRWTLDYPADLEFARQVYAHLYHGQVFLMPEILELLRAHPDLAQINQGIIRNAGYLTSLDKDSTFEKE